MNTPKGGLEEKSVNQPDSPALPGRDVHTSYPKAKVKALLEYLFYKSYGDGICYGWHDHIPIHKLLKKHPDLLQTFMEVWSYQSSPTKAKVEKE